jgi:hypothetical protein
MKNKEAIKRRLDAVKAEPDEAKARGMLADIVYEVGESLCQDFTDLSELVERIKVSIYGNGDPSAAILSRLASVEGAVDTMNASLVFIRTRLFGEVQIGDEEKSFKHQLKDVDNRLGDVEDGMDNIKKLSWIIITLLVTVIGGGILALVVIKP